MDQEIKQLRRENEQLKKSVEILLDWKRQMESSTSIPLNMDQSIKDRFIKPIPILKSSTKSASSENRTVNEGGSATYDVLKPPVIWASVRIGNTDYQFPAYNA